jgi:ABC-type uncharacterized transport system involved in gliding motility auxiliary subunit
MMQRILNILGWVGVALVVAAVGVRLFRPEWDRYAVYTAWAGLVCVLLYPIGQWRQIAASFSRRQSKYATVTATSLLVVLGILIAVNYLSNRRFKRWDLTANLVNSLSEQSLKVVGELESPLKMVVIDQGERLEQHRSRMTMYDEASNQVSVEFLDVVKEPVRAKNYGITAIPTVVIEHEGRTERVTLLEEREITSGIIRAVTGTARKLYFTQGHGERSPAGSEGDDYQYVTTLLKGDNVTVETLALTQHKEVPQDASVVAIVGPTADLLQGEIEVLRAYLNRGGKLLVTLEPSLQKNAAPMPLLTGLIAEWGIEVGNDLVLDISGRTTSAFFVAALTYPSHPITDDFGVGTVFPTVRSINPAAKPPEGKTVQPLVQSPEQAWAETDLAGVLAQKEPEMNADGGDRAGPITIAATVTASVSTPAAEKKDEKKEGEEPPAPPQTRIAVFGDTEFASSNFANQLGNGELLLNTISWLTAQENLISIRAREPSDSRFMITPTQLTAVWWFSVAVVPLAIVATGIFTWARRRRS